MNIAIDIDDTLTESFAYFQPYVAEYFGAEPEKLRARNISYSNLPEPWKQDELGFCKPITTGSWLIRPSHPMHAGVWTG